MSSMNAADVETVRALRGAMALRARDAERELAFAAEMVGEASARAMARRAVALADVTEMAEHLARVPA